MFRTEFLHLLKFQLRFCSFIKCSPLKYNEKLQKLQKLGAEPKTVVFFKLQCILSALYCLAMFVNLCFGWLTLTAKFQGSVFFLLYLFATIARWDYSLNTDVIQVINTFLKFEESAVKSKQKQNNLVYN